MGKRLPKHNEEETTYWLSYSDMMAALLLIFILIITFTILQSKIQYEEKEQQLIEQQQTLLKQTALAAEQQGKLDEQQGKLDEQQGKLDEQQGKLDEQQGKLDEQQGQLDEQQILLDNLLTQNTQKEEQLSVQESIVQKQQTIMEQQQEKLDKLIGVRSNLIEALRNEFKDSSLSIQIDSQTGAITFDSSILFDFNQFELKDSGKEFLVEFLPRYINLLMSDKFADYIGEIIIEGHTDTKGEYLFNLELSQKRALSVAKFCLDDGGMVKLKDVEYLRKIITANGKSYSNPIYNADGTVNMDASRRVEFKFRLKDDEMIQEMQDILSYQ